LPLQSFERFGRLPAHFSIRIFQRANQRLICGLIPTVPEGNGRCLPDIGGTMAQAEHQSALGLWISGAAERLDGSNSDLGNRIVNSSS
jgi:hypothetical protein